MFTRVAKQAASLACLLLYSLALLAQSGAPSQKEKDDLAGFLNSAAAGIYEMAWPTATYRSAEFGGFQREADGIAVIVKLSGEGLFGDNLWLKLGLVVNRNGIQDVRVIDHDALFAPPFATSKAIGDLLVELGKRYAGRQVETNIESQPMAGAVCIVNSTEIDLAFAYRWGDAAWQRDEVEAGKTSVYWWRYQTAEHNSPKFFIRYNDSLAGGDTEQSYWLERMASPLPVTCSQAARYRFGIEGWRVHLRLVN